MFVYKNKDAPVVRIFACSIPYFSKRCIQMSHHNFISIPHCLSMPNEIHRAKNFLHVGVPRFELGLLAPKASMLPLHHTPLTKTSTKLPSLVSHKEHKNMLSEKTILPQDINNL